MFCLPPLFQALFLLTARTVSAGPFPADVDPITAIVESISIITELDVVLTPFLCHNCFPALGFSMPGQNPNSLDEWWCPLVCEHAFMGFSYEITPCQSLDQLKREFADMRNNFNSRYVRLYGCCDQDGFYDDVIEAAWENTLGVHALIWFDFDGNDQWKRRRDALFGALHTNPKAPFVTRAVQFGSEPLFDNAISPEDLASEVQEAKSRLADLHIPVTVSEMASGYMMRGGAQDVLDAVDLIDAHMLPFFAQDATTGDEAWPNVQNDMDWFIQHGRGKKIYFDENGWPSQTSSGVQGNSPSAVASINSERSFYNMLDSHCTDLKKAPRGGVGWFAHIYSDTQEPGYGIYDKNGHLKFPFSPRTSC